MASALAESSPLATDSKNSLWVDDHKAAWSGKRLVWTEPVRHKSGRGPCGYSASLESSCPYYAVLTDREKHVLLYHEVLSPTDKFDQIGGEFEQCIDLNMSITWSAIFTNQTPCITPGSRIWLRRRQRW